MARFFMRWENRNVAKSPRQSDISLLTGLDEKVSRLEERLIALEKRIAASKDEEFEGFLQDRYGYLGDDDRDPAEPEPIAVKRGRRPRIPPDERARRRDDLVHFIELRWPDLVTHLKRRKSMESLLQALKNASPGAESNGPYLHLTEHIGALWEFLQSGRYKGEPRQIAYAMAGGPEKTLGSLFESCTKKTSPVHIFPLRLPDPIWARETH